MYTICKTSKKLNFRHINTMITIHVGEEYSCVLPGKVLNYKIIVKNTLYVNLNMLAQYKTY